MVVETGLTTFVTPDFRNVPPHDPVYHLQFAPAPSKPPEIPRVAELPEHIVHCVVVAKSAEMEFKFTVIALLMQFVVLHHPSALR